MYPLWKQIVEPALVAAQAKRVVEIGALRGDTTIRLLELLGPEVEVHVIDPVPIFDPTEHEKRFPGRYVFHRDISHNVLSDLPAVDAALIDGDHNWFTVHTELTMLRDSARAAGAPLPFVVMHDVAWPYGRRDLYYAPERIPEKHRQPFARRGMLPNRAELVEKGGLNPQLDNAVSEGGPRNGVMTALEDFAADHDRPLRCVVVPIYYGLALVAEQELLDARPQLAKLLDRLESPEGLREVAELAEAIRLEEQIQHQDAHLRIKTRAERVARLYLDLLKGAVLDEHYLENELRIEHLLECLEVGTAVSPAKLRDPVRYMSKELRRLREARRAGTLPGDSSNGSRAIAYTSVGRVRLDHLEHCLDVIREEAVQGDLVDCDAGRGGTAIFMRGYLQAYGVSRPEVWLADRFLGVSTSEEQGEPVFSADLNTVREGFARFGLFDGRVKFLQGAPTTTLPSAEIGRIALLRIDSHDPDVVQATLESLYDRVALGGFVVIDDYGVPECEEVVEAFRAERGITEPLERVDWSGASWRKTAPAAGASAPPSPRGSARARERPEETRSTTSALSVVVVVFNMRREAARTLYSLSRKYQQGIEELDYEVVVVENGSQPDQRLGEEFVRSFGPEFRYLDLGEEATPSPAAAVNRGIAASGGEAVAVIIDGAHVLTPGVLRYGMLGIESHAPAVVTTQQWYVGPGQQNDMVAKGYDADYEDRLFKEIQWPIDGYKLFEIGHFIGDRDWFDGQWESNCVFLPRRLLEQAGGMDESFAIPGGGFVNLDFFERMVSAPGVNLVTILGEGSFHQVHGGTTTNVGEAGERTGLISSYGDDYAELRGRAFKVPDKLVHYVGTLPEAARRTKARRMGAPIYFKLAHTEGVDGRPVDPVPVPEELRTEFIDAFWRSKEWHRTTWLGRWMDKAPTDLLAYQDLLFRVKPGWIVETGTGGGGRAFFLATVFDLMGEGRILSIDDGEVEKLVKHPRITHLRKDPLAEETAAEARDLLGERPRALLILGAAKAKSLRTAFERYGPLVPKGSYVVAEATILNGHPVWTGFGPGPFEFARELVNGGDFVPDPEFERYALTFNPGGFLKRIR